MTKFEGSECLFCGCLRCFYDIHATDMKSSLLRDTGYPAHVSLARHTLSLGF